MRRPGTRLAASVVIAVSVALPPAAQSGVFQPGGTSPRIQTLEREFSQKGATPVAEFWAEVARIHAPLIEPVPGQPDQVRVTFVYRSAPDITSVKAFNLAMTRVAATDVWFATMTMNKAR
jgi:hypothetical protein